MMRIGEADALLPHLLQFTPAHREAARVLRGDVASFGDELRTAVAEMWAEETATSAAAEGWAARLAGMPPPTNAAERVPRPSVAVEDGGAVGLLLRRGSASGGALNV